MENLEKLATYDTQDEETQNKNITQYVMETTMSKQSQKSTLERLERQIINKNLRTALRKTLSLFTIYKDEFVFMVFNATFNNISIIS